MFILYHKYEFASSYDIISNFAATAWFKAANAYEIKHIIIVYNYYIILYARCQYIVMKTAENLNRNPFYKRLKGEHLTVPLIRFL